MFTKNVIMKIIAISLGIALILLFLLHSCKVSPNAKDPEMTLTRKVIVDRSDKGYYSIKFNKIGEWKIYKGPSIEKIDWTKFSLIDGDMVQLPAPYPNPLPINPAVIAAANGLA